MGAKSADDIRGFEFDWLAVDVEGHVGFLSTAGGGYAPEEFLKDTDAYDHAVEDILALPESTESTHSPQLDPGLQNTWRLMAERGIFAFDSDPHGGPYRLVASPVVPVQVASLPRGIAEVVRQIKLDHLRFSGLHEGAALPLRKEG